MNPDELTACEAARAAYEQVHGPRPEPPVPSPNGNYSAWEECRREYDRNLANLPNILRALQQYGYKVVPMEPTKEMAQAAWNAYYSSDKLAPFNMVRDAVIAAIAASPEMPT